MKIFILFIFGLLIFIFIIRSIATYRNSFLYKTGKIQQYREKANKLRLISKKKQVDGIKQRLQNARTDKERAGLERILREQTVFLNRMLSKARESSSEKEG